MSAPVRFLGGPFDGLETRKVRACRHGNMPDVHLCVRVVSAGVEEAPDWDFWPDTMRMMTTPESAAAWSPTGPDGAYDVARYEWHDEAGLYLYAETTRRELRPGHEREGDR